MIITSRFFKFFCLL